MVRLPCLYALLISAALPQQPFDVHALLKIQRISDPQISPDGRSVAFVVENIELEKNRRIRHIYGMPVAGGNPVRLTNEGSSNQRPRWSPDSRHIAFISDRTGTPQVWIMKADGSEPRQVTRMPTGARGVLFTPDGKHLLFTAEVYPECGADEACNQKKLDEENASPVTARIYTSLLYRHWDRWQSRRRSHLLAIPVEGGKATDLTPGDRHVPPFSLGGPDDYAVSPDGSEVCYVMVSDPEPAVSTNTDLYVVPISGGQPTRITSNPAADNSPAYSPDGKYLAFRMQTRPGYESDRWRLAVLERATGKLTVLTENLDRWVTGFTWSPDSTRIFYTVEDRGRQVVHMVPVTGGGARTIVGGPGYVSDVQFTPDGKTMVYLGQSGVEPARLYRVSSAGGAPEPLTRLNDVLLSNYRLSEYEEFWVEAPDRVRVHSFLVKPHGFREDRKYPVLFLIHGGPQSAWENNWGYRWNPQVFAGAGYVVVLPNPRGSTGFGQKFIDEINADWGGKVYDDIMAVVDYVTALPYVDAERMAAAGGSYGGYMVNWILGHTQRFRALVSHAGVFDLRSMFGETEELWFPLWEFLGAPWDNPELYARFSPSYYAKNFRTPTLVIHGELDYRVPYGQGLQLFTALQLQKVPSKLLLFPDEGHWILKPQNSVLWYRTFLDWINEWVGKRPPAPGAPAPKP
ncbi:MAG: S9 family peptidase [Bryobacterales bacterium]|nr:S9 family peptidase [Bryobacteraceae bacterium]MDW8130522.1 S9 family peptidase [Bryobacterales bacterium]